MEEHIDFAPLLLVSALAFLIPMLTHRYTGGAVPSVVGEIVAGVIFGASVVGVIEENVWLEFLSLFGFAYLMFLSGLEVDVALLLRPLGPRFYRPRNALRHPLVGSLILIGLVMGATAGAVLLLNAWGQVEDFWFPLFIFAATAVGVMVPVLKDREEGGPFGQMVLVSGFLLEFVAIVGIGIVAAVEREGLGLEAGLILAMPAAFALLLWLTARGRTHFPGVVTMMSDLAHASSQIQIRGSLTVLVVFVVLSQVVGTEFVLGAFLAGLGLSIISPQHGSIMRVKLDAMGYGFFVPIFFITAGATMELDAIFDSADSLLLIPAFLAIAFTTKMIPGLLVLVPTFGWRRALAGGTLMSANLSLILAAAAIALELGRIDEATNAAFLVVALVTTAVAPLAFNRLVPPAEEADAVRALVVGAGRTGQDSIPRLLAADLAVTVIDRDPARLQPWTVRGCETLAGDATQTAFLQPILTPDLQVAVIALEDTEVTLRVAAALRELDIRLRVVTWVSEPDRRLDALEVEWYTLGSATAVALEGAVLRPGLFQMLARADSGVDEVPLRNPVLYDAQVRDVPLPPGARILVIVRDGELIVPEGTTVLHPRDRVTLAGEPAAVARAYRLFSGRRSIGVESAAGGAGVAVGGATGVAAASDGPRRAPRTDADESDEVAPPPSGL